MTFRVPTPGHGHRAATVASLIVVALGCDRGGPTEGDAPPPLASPAKPQKVAPDTSGWQLTDAQRAQPLIRVGDDVMTLGFFVDTMGPDLQTWRRVNGAASANAKLDEVLEGHLTNMLLAKSATAAGYYEQPAAIALRKERLVATLGQALVDAEGEAFNVITDADRQRYHAEHRAEFTKPAALRMSAIEFASRPEARQQLERLQTADNPATVMAEIGITRAKNLGMFPVDERLPVEPPTAGVAPSIGPALRAAANTLTKNGEFYPEVLAGPTGFLLLKRTGERPERVTPPDRLKVTLQRRILTDRRQGLLDALADRLESEANVTWQDGNLARVRVAP